MFFLSIRKERTKESASFFFRWSGSAKLTTYGLLSPDVLSMCFLSVRKERTKESAYVFFRRSGGSKAHKVWGCCRPTCCGCAFFPSGKKAPKKVLTSFLGGRVAQSSQHVGLLSPDVLSMCFLSIRKERTKESASFLRGSTISRGNMKFPLCQLLKYSTDEGDARASLKISRSRRGRCAVQCHKRF